MKYTSFEDMPAWKAAMEIATSIFEITSVLPRCEDYGLTSQIRRASVSVSANLAEGFGRASSPDKTKFYIIARGSLFETKSHLLYGMNVKYFEKELIKKLNLRIENLIYEINKLIKSLNVPKP